MKPLLILLLPPLGLLEPKRVKDADGKRRRNSAGHQQEHSARCVTLTFALLGHTLFRFASDPELTSVHRNAWVPLLTFNMPEWAEYWTYAFWYVVLAALVLASYPDRPASKRETALERFGKMLMPEVVALFFFCGADAMLTVLSDVEMVGKGKYTLKRCSGVLVHAMLDALPRFWLMVNFTLLISATIAGGISPPTHTFRGACFDSLWPVVVMQLTSMVVQRSAERTQLVQSVLQDDRLLALCCGLSVLFFTHSFAMSMAIVFRTHEQTHEVPTCQDLLMRVIEADSAFGAFGLWTFMVAWYIFNFFIDPGMMENRHEEIMISAMNVVALGIALYNLVWGKVGHRHNTLESSLTIFVGSVASLCWWGELHSPDSAEDATPFRTGVIALCTVTHVVLTFFFADVFSHKLDPPAWHCVALTFWAGTMLFVGAKLEHHSALEHSKHKRDSMLEWELLVHLGEFGLCEFGLVSTVAWITHLAVNSQRWWIGRRGSLTKPLLHHEGKQSLRGLEGKQSLRGLEGKQSPRGLEGKQSPRSLEGEQSPRAPKDRSLEAGHGSGNSRIVGG